MKTRTPLPPLLCELLQASRVAHEPRLQDILAGLGLVPDGSLWGFDFVDFAAGLYDPRPGGDGALILPAFDGGIVIDLAACRIRDRHVATRYGVARALGEEAIAQAILQRTPLSLLSDPLRWLMAGRRGAVVLDWSQAPPLFDGLEEIACDSPALASRVNAATRRTARLPEISHSPRPGETLKASHRRRY
jgi:hypothetical protein